MGFGILRLLLSCLFFIFFCLERSRKGTNRGKGKRQEREKIGEKAGM
jgi:hypothetical protein